MRLHRLSKYSVRILVLCAKADGRLVKVSELTRQLGIPESQVLKTTGHLARIGAVKTVKGPLGGVSLGRPADEIRLGDIVDLGEQQAEGRANYEALPELLQLELFEAAGSFIAVLNRYSILDLL